MRIQTCSLMKTAGGWNDYGHKPHGGPPVVAVARPLASHPVASRTLAT
jgi:hypothetical protein